MVSWCTHLYKGVCALGQRLSLLSRSRARPSFFDFWVSGRPPAASEGVGPPRLKTKTKCSVVPFLHLQRQKQNKSNTHTRHLGPGALFTRARDVQTGLPGESEWRGSRLGTTEREPSKSACENGAARRLRYLVGGS